MNENETRGSRPERPESRIRDHLANERTFLAWIRTALGLIGIGFVLARMGVFLRQITTLSVSVPHHEIRGSHEYLITGVLFLLLGTAVSIGSGWFYHRSRKAIDSGQFEPARRTITAMTAMIALGSLTVTGLLLWQLVTLGD
jgi:putative membrane protein